MRPRKEPVPFTSAMTRGEYIAALIYLPIHLVLLPLALGMAMGMGLVDEAQANFLCYAIGVAYMLIFMRRFLRRDFDPLCDRPLNILLEICIGYGLMLCFNLLVSFLLQLVSNSDNLNNTAIVGMAAENYGAITAMATFMAPVVEELIFRGAVFGLVRRYSRFWAYAASMLLFSLYHVWSYALGDPSYWLYIVQYLPVSFLLCRCYERCNSIWGSIFFHMLVNSIAMQALLFLQELL